MFTDLYMITEEGLPFINEYVDSLNKILKTKNKQLSKIQSTWLGFIVWCIITTNTVCYSAPICQDKFSPLYRNKPKPLTYHRYYFHKYTETSFFH